MIPVYLNLGVPESLEAHNTLPFDGIGLFRLEFLIAASLGQHPAKMLMTEGGTREYEAFLETAIRGVVTQVSPRPVFVRFSDLKSSEYRCLPGGREVELEEPNPALGARGLARHLMPKHRACFEAECRALARVARTGEASLKAMLPFVRAPWEVEEALAVLETNGLGPKSGVGIILMAETPAMAVTMDDFNRFPIEGYSIGTNDLTQLLYGIDRDYAAFPQERYLAPASSALSNAIQAIIRGAKRGGKTVSLCGELPSIHPEISATLAEWGIDTISVNAGALEAVKEILQAKG